MPLDSSYYAAKTVTVFGKAMEITVFTEPMMGSDELGKIRVSETWNIQRPNLTMDSFITKQAIVQLIAALQGLAERMTEEE